MEISLLNLNMMHGKNTKVPWWPISIPKTTIEQNLIQIAHFIKQYNPDVITLQEVDYNAFSTGRIDELQFLNGILEYPYTQFGPEFETPYATFGNAILSRYPIQSPQSFKFTIGVPTPRKGFMHCYLDVSGTKISLVNIHTTWLNFLVPKHRARELSKVTKFLKNIHELKIVSGDFNDEYISKQNDNIKTFLAVNSLKTHLPEAKNLKTFPSDNLHERIDWIMISDKLEFSDYQTIETKISDHVPLFAKIIIPK